MRIYVKQGLYKKIKITDCSFELLSPIYMESGKMYARVNASQLLGKDYSDIKIEIYSYKVIE